jgi:hypothetical protein
MNIFSRTFCLVSIHLLVFTAFMQAQTERKSFVIQKAGVSNVSDQQPDYFPALLVREMPSQRANQTEYYDYPAQVPSQQARPTNTLLGLIKGQSFSANPFSVSTPCDNDLAISDSGFVVSTANTNIYFRNTTTGQNFPAKSLAGFTNPINSYHREFDPKVIYDPEADRFIIMCLVGTVDTNSKIIVGFSQTSNPTQGWNLYTLPGDPLNTGHWSDYPKVSLTKKDFYLSINLLYNDSSWQTGFVQTLIWQIDKNKGYQGLPLRSDLHYNIKHNGRFLRNLCPAKGGSQLYGPNMYFLSNRNLASQNDTVFLVNVTDTTGAPSNTVTTRALVSNQRYFFPPDGRQPIATQSLATNDCRNLGAFFENNTIQYVHNTANPANGRVTVYHGIINNVSGASPVVTGNLLPNDTMDFAYPNISYAGVKFTQDNRSIITFDHSSNRVFPGVSAIHSDGQGNYSSILRIQNGTQYVNLLTANLERWGDYSGSQRRYNRPGEVWMSGYYGYNFSASYPYAHGTWIAQITNSVNPFDDTRVPAQTSAEAGLSVYPNPATDLFSVDIQLASPEYLNIELFDQNGKSVQVLLRDWVKGLNTVFTFNTRDLSKGLYVLRITGNKGTSITHKIIIK